MTMGIGGGGEVGDGGEKGGREEVMLKRMGRRERESR